jgi:hypothetical protein
MLDERSRLASTSPAKKFQQFPGVRHWRKAMCQTLSVRLLAGADQVARCRSGMSSRPPEFLAYGLDIFAPGKVPNMEWDGGGDRFLVTTFKRGAWEAELMAAR